MSRGRKSFAGQCGFWIPLVTLHTPPPSEMAALSLLLPRY